MNVFPTNNLPTRDARAYELAALREEREDLASRMMLNDAGRRRLAELNAILA